MRLITLLSFAFIAIACSHCDPVPDTNVSAAEGKDATIALSGCGQKGNLGYLFCRVVEGSDPALTPITLTVPDWDCNHASCAEFIFAKPDGTLGYGAGIPKHQTQFTFTLKDMIQSGAAIVSGNEAEYAMSIRAFFMNTGVEQSMTTRGYVRLHILSKNYIPAVCNESMISFTRELYPDCSIQYTTKFRGAICGKGCE